MIPLKFVKSGDNVKIIKISGDGSLRQHLKDLGFVNDTVASVVTSHGGDVILNIKNTRVALTREMAGRIMIDIV
jgi:ferrous iron transport protein A